MITIHLKPGLYEIRSFNTTLFWGPAHEAVKFRKDYPETSVWKITQQRKIKIAEGLDQCIVYRSHKGSKVQPRSPRRRLRARK